MQNQGEIYRIKSIKCIKGKVCQSEDTVDLQDRVCACPSG